MSNKIFTSFTLGPEDLCGVSSGLYRKDVKFTSRFNRVTRFTLSQLILVCSLDACKSCMFFFVLLSDMKWAISNWTLSLEEWVGCFFFSGRREDCHHLACAMLTVFNSTPINSNSLPFWFAQPIPNCNFRSLSHTDIWQLVEMNSADVL